jgi:hypothetical protein
MDQDKKAACYIYCRLEVEAICGPWDIAGAGIGYATGSALGATAGSALGRTLCAKLLIEDGVCMKKCLETEGSCR